MKRSLTILSLVILSFLHFVTAWGETDADICLKAYEVKNYGSAYPACLKEAKKGNSDAQNSLGNLYFNGQGVNRSTEEAAVWYNKAAKQGNIKAISNLGNVYYEQHNYIEALVWVSKAAEQGFAPAQVNLGTMYTIGQGVKQDYPQAIKWFRKAADQGNADGQFRLALIHYQGRGVKQDYKEAARLCRLAAEQGVASAQFQLGFMYSNGFGVKQDYVEAVNWFHKAAEESDCSGQVKTDSQLSRFLETPVLLFKLSWGKISQIGMKTVTVIKHLNILDDVLAGFVAC